MLKDKTQLANELKEKYEQQKQVVNEMRLNFQKDITHLREQIFKREKLGEQFKEIDVKYFDITEGLPEQYSQILNTKIFDMKQGYQKILREISLSNESLTRQVAILDIINKEGIKFKEMNADHLIRRLNLIEKQPQVIWEVIHKYYGDDFFIQNIEDEYGISPNSYDTLLKQMQEQFKAYQDQTETKLKELKDHYLSQLNFMRKDLQSKTEEIGRLNRQIFIVIEKTREETEIIQEQLFKQKEINLFNRYDNEKQELYDKIRELETACEDFEHSRMRILEKSFFTKWLFFTHIHKIKGSQGETKQMLAERTEHMLIERELKLQEIKKIADEHQGFKEENFKLSNDVAMLQYQLSVLTNQNTILDQNLHQMTENIENLIQDNSQNNRDKERLMLENLIMKQSKQDHEAFVKNLEDQITLLKQKVERGVQDNGRVTQKSAIKSVQNTIYKQLNDLSNQATNDVTEMQKQEFRDAACLTMIAGLNKPVGLIMDKVNAPKYSQQVQVYNNEFGTDQFVQCEQEEKIQKENQEIQVELGTNNNQSNNDHQQESFFLTSNMMSNRNEKSTNNKISEFKTADEMSYIQSQQINSSKRFNKNEIIDSNRPNSSARKYNQLMEYKGGNIQGDDFEDINVDQDQIPNDTITSLQFKAKSQNHSRIVSATKRLQILPDSKSSMALIDGSFPQNEQVDEEGNILMYNPESGKTFKIQYNKYLKSINYQLHQAKRDIKSSFRLQEKEGDENVYKRLWNDINLRNEKQQATHSFIQEQRISHLDKVMKYLNDDKNLQTKQIKRSNSVSHQLNEALVFLQSLNSKDPLDPSLQLQEDNKDENPSPIKRKKSNQSKINVNQKQQLCKIIPYNLKIMSNILGKVYTEKRDKGIQVDDQSREAENLTNERLEEHYKNLKKVKQKRIRQGKVIGSSFNNNNMEGFSSYGSKIN